VGQRPVLALLAQPLLWGARHGCLMGSAAAARRSGILPRLRCARTRRALAEIDPELAGDAVQAEAADRMAADLARHAEGVDAERVQPRQSALPTPVAGRG
jgi:hypothetical protein